MVPATLANGVAGFFSMWRLIKSYLFYTWGGLHRYFGNQNNLANEHRRAVHYFTRAYETNPQMKQALLARAVLLGRELEETEAALADLETLLVEDPANGPALFNRALIYQQQGEYRLALADLNQYLRVPQTDDYRESVRQMRRLLEAIVEDETG